MISVSVLFVSVLKTTAILYCNESFRKWIFPSKDKKSLQNVLGGENSFRKLKYWHKNKYNGILQEIATRMLLYNFCELVTAHAVVQTAENVKHIYKIHFATPVNICRAYLKTVVTKRRSWFSYKGLWLQSDPAVNILSTFNQRKIVFLACLRIFSWHKWMFFTECAAQIFLYLSLTEQYFLFFKKIDIPLVR